MNTFQKMVMLAFCAIVVVACNKPAEPVTTFDLEKAKTAIADVNQKLMTAFNSGDSVGFAALYHSQAIVMPANDEAVTGDKMVSAVSGAVTMGMQLKFTTNAVWGDADLVVEEGAYEMTDKAGSHIDHGKYIVLWKEENGQWKLFRDIWNSSMPMQPPPAEASK